MKRIEKKFAELKSRGDKALIPYIMAGDPSLQETESLILALERGGADLIELGVPFSDPIADGPVIQRAGERALRHGASLRRILEVVAAVRHRTAMPLILMTYYNTIHAFGEPAFCAQAAAAGVDGVIVPDLPPEEATLLTAAGSGRGPALIFMLAPTSTAARRAAIARRTGGFLYYVSLTGITGAKLADIEDVRGNVARIRKVAGVPVVVGFGIATADDVARIAPLADGVVVGTAMVRTIDAHRDDPQMLRTVEEYVRTLKAATRPVESRASA